MFDAVAAGWSDDQAIDTFADQEVDGRFFRIELFARIRDDDVESSKTGRVADAAYRQTEESVLDIADHDPDDAGPSGAHAPGELVRAVFEGGGRRHDLICDLGADHAVAAEHTGGRRLRNLCGLGDVGDRNCTFRMSGIFHEPRTTRVVDDRSIDGYQICCETGLFIQETGILSRNLYRNVRWGRATRRCRQEHSFQSGERT